MPGEPVQSNKKEDDTVKRSWLGRFASMPNDSITKTLIVALLVALFGSILVSAATVILRPKIQANMEQERQRNLQEIVQRLPGSEQLLGGVGSGSIDAHVVDLVTDDFDRSRRPAEIDARTQVQDPARSIAIPPERDIAGIRQVSRYQIVYTVRSNGELQLIILPVYGQGYASTLYGYLGLAGDANTVVGLGFYEHGETPGLGAQVDSPQWREQWQGKRVYDQEGRLRIGVARVPLSPDDPDAPYKVDGLSGATYTSQGVNNLLRFWLGEDGFGPFLSRVRQE